MQRVSGTINPGAHPGSYNGQDAYNDMLVVEDGHKYKQGELSHHSEQRQGGEFGVNRLQRSPNNFEGGGVKWNTL